MARTETIQIELGYAAPDFCLPDVITGNSFSLNDLRGELATVVVFICNHCPYVQHIMAEMVKTASDFFEKGVRFIAVNSNDTDLYPEDSPEKMKLFAQEYDFVFPYLFDETQKTAKQYVAACTPDFSVFDKNLICAYRGNFDTSTPKNNLPVTGQNLRNAIELILQGEEVPNQIPSVGCNIKWRT